MYHVSVDQNYPRSLIQFLVEFNDIALDHQIQAATRGKFQSLPESWIAWASEADDRWKDIMAVYVSDDDQVYHDMPADLHRFIRDSASITLPRSPFFVPEDQAPARVHGVSPKKIHEVWTMASYITALLSTRSVKPIIVDIGAGQGYLSRALSSSPGSFHVLALDSNDSQTAGSIARKDWMEMPETVNNVESSNGSGSLTQKTVFIGDATSLKTAIEEWIRDDLQQQSQQPIPVVLVGLHCCGDLTPAILRFVEQSLPQNDVFELVGCVIVGCCYNMCNTTSFPLSRSVSIDLSHLGPLSLDTQHLHLAAQTPLTWDLATPKGVLTSSSAALAIRKVTYRSLLARRLPALYRPEGDLPMCSDVDWRQKRVGRLRDSAYKDFPTYLQAAREKLGLRDKPIAPQDGPEESKSEYDLSSDLNSEEVFLSRTLEVLYVLRCLLGPPVESLIAVDRYLFLKEAIDNLVNGTDTDATSTDQSSSESDRVNSGVKLVNLFDQSTGSLRNLALAWER